MTNTLLLVVGFVFQLLCLFFWVRFLLQASDCDRHNPISQGVVKASDKVCRPIRMVLPAIGRFDSASLLVAFVIAIIGVAVSASIDPRLTPSFPGVIIAGVLQALMVATNFYLFSVIIVVIASFVSPGTYNPGLTLINQILAPLMNPLRKILPPMGGFDLSPMVLVLFIWIVQGLLVSI